MTKNNHQVDSGSGKNSLEAGKRGFFCGVYVLMFCCDLLVRKGGSSAFDQPVRGIPRCRGKKHSRKINLQCFTVGFVRGELFLSALLHVILKSLGMQIAQVWRHSSAVVILGKETC